MHRATLLIAAGLASLSTACATKTPGIAMTASDFDLNPLVGVWRGSYSNPQTGRTGTVAFTLRAGESSATGNVVMIPRADSLLTAEDREMVNNVAESRSVLNISFIRKEGGSVNGTLDPYRSPDCDCIVRTNFQGVFTDAATIQGTFTVVPTKPGSSISTGTWKVTRVKKL